jgi:fluoride exporter
MKALLLAGLGSMAGGMTRYAISATLNGRHWLGFPIGTLLVNLAGCLLMGFLIGAAAKNPALKTWLPLLGAGMLGGFTTFSAFSAESVLMLESGKFTALFWYLLISIAGGLALTWMAYRSSVGG